MLHDKQSGLVTPDWFSYLAFTQALPEVAASINF